MSKKIKIVLALVIVVIIAGLLAQISNICRRQSGATTPAIEVEKKADVKTAPEKPTVKKRADR